MSGVAKVPVLGFDDSEMLDDESEDAPSEPNKRAFNSFIAISFIHGFPLLQLWSSKRLRRLFPARRYCFTISGLTFI